MTRQVRVDLAAGAGRLLTELQGAPDAQLVAVFERAELIGRAAWISASIAAGLLHERAEHGDQVLEQLAERLGCHRAHAHRFVLVFRAVVRPLLDRDPEASVAPVPMAWSVAAAKLARRTGRPALALLEDAQRAVAADPRLSVPRWRRQVLGLPDERESGSAARVRRALEVIARLRAADLDVFDPELVEAVRRVVDARRAA